MKFETSKKILILTRYRKPILFGFLVAFAIGMGAMGFLVYRTGIFAKAKVSAIQNDVTETVPEVSIHDGGVVERLLIGLASDWVQKNLSSTEAVRFKSGLSCFNALGGPSPRVIINRVKAQVDDVNLLARLNELGTSFDKSAPQVNGSASCASWILSG